MFIHRPTPHDKVVGRQPETTRWFAKANQHALKPAGRIIRICNKCGSTSGPGEFGPNPSGFSFARWTNIGLAKPLDLAHKFPPAERFYLSKKGSKADGFKPLHNKAPAGWTGGCLRELSV